MRYSLDTVSATVSIASSITIRYIYLYSYRYALRYCAAPDIPCTVLRTFLVPYSIL